MIPEERHDVVEQAVDNLKTRRVSTVHGNHVPAVRSPSLTLQTSIHRFRV